MEPVQNQRGVLVFTGVVYEGPFDENGLRHGKGLTTLPSGVAHAGVYEKGRLDYSAKCTLTVPEGGAFPRPAQTNCRCWCAEVVWSVRSGGGGRAGGREPRGAHRRRPHLQARRCVGYQHPTHTLRAARSAAAPSSPLVSLSVFIKLQADLVRNVSREEEGCGAGAYAGH